LGSYLIESDKYLLAKLITKGKILSIGKYRLSNGIESPYYLDFTLLSSRIDLLKTLINLIDKQFSKYIELEDSNKLIGVLDKGAAITIPLAIKKNKPFALYSPEKNEISVGFVDVYDDIVLIDDMLSTGNTVKKIIEYMEGRYGVKIRKVYIALDREEGGYHLLRKMGIQVYRLAKISDIIKILHDLGVLTDEEYSLVIEHIKAIEKQYS